ncbi:type II toxin-antitoxin system Phd/YefM family antitoxin [Ruegeria sp. YS9]|uniref:type II toxin-antitoxin system Phd/YefM family antitoxin n=1 Tax=Ruegeria sp. YS9 TaxID=2966453 RepID=UPI00214BCEA4|nr:type II toxin-antitoxin system Phd/YefM family antitoxin [Ruegeria sp. YS9]UUV06912.1 type II toxin-antitoxin system Phd/YefM family antitoxin [Ruegeria sp. YS9]
MRCTISHARANLGALVTRAQDPREVIILTRHGKPLAALVSVAEAKRIWHLQDDDEIGWKHPLSGIRGMWSQGRNIPGMEPGPDGSYVTAREAALKVREIQMTRAEERRILARGGLDPVAGGELAARPVSSLWRRLFRF